MPRETFYDEVEIEDFKWDPKANVYHYPCPCGDRFEISKSQLRDGDEVARCPSCSLIVRVVYEWDDYEEYDSGEEESLEAELESKTGNEDETKVTNISTSYISAPTAAPSKGIPSTLLSKLAIRDEENKEDRQGKDKPGDHITADLRTNEKETDGKEKGGETDGKDFGKGKRPGSPPPRSPKRLEVELE